MSLLHWTAEDVFGLPGMPDEAMYAAIDHMGKIWLFSERFMVTVDEEYDEKDRVILPLNHDYEGDWRESLLVREK